MADNKKADTSIQGESNLTFSIKQDSYDPALLQSVLEKVTNNPVKVDKGKVTLSSDDAIAVKEVLATVGLEVLEGMEKEMTQSKEKSKVTAGGSEDGNDAGEDKAMKKVMETKSEDADEGHNGEVPEMTAESDEEMEYAEKEEKEEEVVAESDEEMEYAEKEEKEEEVVAESNDAGEDKAMKKVMETKSEDADEGHNGEVPEMTAESDEEKEEKAEAMDEDEMDEDEVYANAGKRIGLAGQYQMIVSKTDGDAHWIIIAGTEPVARISLSAQDNASAMASIFATEDYGQSISKSFEKNGYAATLALLKAEIFTSAVVRPRSEVDLTEIEGAAVRKFKKCFALANKAAYKNIIQNPLKAKAFDLLAGKGIEDPQEIVEAMFTAMDDYLEVIDARTDKYLAMDESALAASEDMLAEMDVQISDGNVSATAESHSFAQKLAAGSLPLTVPVTEKVEASEDIRRIVKLKSKY